MTTSVDTATTRRSLGAAVVFALAVTAVAVVGSLAAGAAAQEYTTLRRPVWAPPSWLFGPVWTVLYVMIAAAGWLVWRRAGSVAAASRELGVYAIQLLLNMAWTPLFFGTGMYGLALVEILVLVVAIVMTAVLFARRHRVAALLLVPYLAWTLFATALNGAIWMLNM